ncbi:hypothetical protein METBIDRAFT_9801 [Metschnikowia bicuspidata var. bicuspidata NRRL YB-4993]|uniref:Uncharacterized protein n=1 Tax=Metschnikowia bicuspidata var. bicuspidata NRRL YB-4993 TaxID=869754 RepID=A0A1A0HI38_9ASCO|nr:hypothetical protein METBIDRAFT_9801 [Metschnikowia bicuspidata var. bicuspidata NRRL YB-4993]OBA23547.1 hypothetical protein METBIDRAFT_9801 [Metschnikowia bicuspidata var. bicuspidata NRRL YB-4993]
MSSDEIEEILVALYQVGLESAPTGIPPTLPFARPSFEEMAVHSAPYYIMCLLYLVGAVPFVTPGIEMPGLYSFLAYSVYNISAVYRNGMVVYFGRNSVTLDFVIALWSAWWLIRAFRLVGWKWSALWFGLFWVQFTLVKLKQYSARRIAKLKAAEVKED